MKWVALALVLGGCLEASVAVCDDGTICAPGDTCAPGGGCVSDAQVEACAGREEGEPCALAGADEAACRGGVCTALACGDGSVDNLEQCDGANLDGKTCADAGFYGGTLGCDVCRFDTSACVGRCGDGEINGDGVELCDDTELTGLDCTDFGYYAADGLRCTISCGFDTSACLGFCGDAILDDAEDCEPALALTADCTDLGFYEPAGLVCHSGCGFDDDACVGRCGDGLVNGPEPCDGAPPAGLACTTEGWDAGQLACGAGCQPSTGNCRVIGFDPEYAGGPTTLYDVWGDGDDFVAVGLLGAAVRSSGGAWTHDGDGLSSLVNYFGVWGASADDVFTVGSPSGGFSTIFRQAGGTWSRMTVPGAAQLEAIWGSAADDVYAVGAGSTVLHFDGLAWSTVSTPAPGGISLQDVWGVDGEVWAVGLGGVTLHHDGSSWTHQNLGGGVDLLGVWGAAADDVYAVGANGAIRHWDGDAWSVMTSCASTGTTLRGVGAQPDGVVVTGGIDGSGRGVVCALVEGKWFPIDVGEVDPIQSIYGTSHQLVAAGGGSHLVSRGAIWLDLPELPGGITASAVWASSATDIHVVGMANNAAVAYWFDGTSWTTPAIAGAGPILHDVWGAAKDAVFAVGPTGRVLRFDGTSWIEEDSDTTGELRAVWGTGADDVFAVGDFGAITHRSGTTWTAQSSPVITNLASVWGTSPTSVFAVGDGGTILRYDGSTWTEMTSGTTARLNRVWGRSATDVYVTGNLGTVLRYDGVAWTAMPSGIDGLELKALGGAGGDALLAPTFGSELLELAGGRWTAVATPEPISNLTDIHGEGQLSLILSGSGTLLALAGRIHHPAASETACGDFWDDDADGLADCADPECADALACVAPGACEPAVIVGCGESVDGTTAGGPTRWPYYGAGCDPRNQRGAEAYYRVARPTAGTIEVTLTSTTHDLIAAARGPSGACIPDLACLDASQTSNATETVTIDAATATDYVVIVDSTSADAAGFTLQVACP